MKDRTLLEAVVRHKKAFFHSSRANYDACLARKLRLIPGAPMQTELDRDYQAMVDAGMFVGDAPRFETLMERLRDLEQEINRSA